MTKTGKFKTPCRCRNCGKIYEEDKSRADWKGYCSQACVHEQSRKHGFKNNKQDKLMGRYESTVLLRANKIGSVYVDSEGRVL